MKRTEIYVKNIEHLNKYEVSFWVNGEKTEDYLFEEEALIKFMRQAHLALYGNVTHMHGRVKKDVFEDTFYPKLEIKEKGKVDIKL